MSPTSGVLRAGLARLGVTPGMRVLGVFFSLNDLEYKKTFKQALAAIVEITFQQSICSGTNIYHLMPQKAENYQISKKF